jgi:predicted dienelactone hydrolase
LESPSRDRRDGEASPQDSRSRDCAGTVEPTLVTFAAPDGTDLSADLYAARDGTRAPIILLFHQAASNAGEYADIAPHLVELGWNALAVDTRAGGRMWNRNNRTVMRLGRSTDFSVRIPIWRPRSLGRRNEATPVLSPCGAAATLPRSCCAWRRSTRTSARVLSFSPGEYLGPGEPVRAAAAKVKGSDLRHHCERARGRRSALDSRRLAFRAQSAVRSHRGRARVVDAPQGPQSGGTDENWEAVASFLAQLRSRLR